jgi:hypothetical protein
MCNNCSDIDSVSDCKVHKNEVDKVHGFSQLTDYNVQSVINNGVKVSWEAPLGTSY